ncbi:hypothetical protein ACIP4T_08240 [Streptomyces massasporeus]|uniref:hypothetical protein n=1 Tax=Streptomyces massasporeus TaxID=67324 RepID=UPI0036EA3595
MRRPVEGEVHVHYGQIYVESDPDDHGPGLAEAFAGQRVGLCGAATPGFLWLNTGLHTGDVGFTVEVRDQAPLLDPAWEDVVEVSFRPASAQSALVQWAGEDSWDLDLEETDHRVRYCASGMDRASETDTRSADEPQLDRYLLQFWPAPPEPDRVLKETSRTAAYWHRYARTLPPPPTPAERAETARRERLARETEEREQQLAHERRQWGGRLPSDALRTVGGNVSGLRDFDPALLHAIDAAGPAIQRAVARFAARRACEAAGLTALGWVAHALTALAEDHPLPPPFDDDARMWHALASDPDVPDRTVGRAVPPERPPSESADSALTSGLFQTAAPFVVGPAAAFEEWQDPSPSGEEPLDPSPSGEEWQDPSPSDSVSSPLVAMLTIGRPDPSLRISQPHMALPAVTAAADPDPLRAALDAVYAAVVTYGEDHPALLAEVWSFCEERLAPPVPRFTP